MEEELGSRESSGTFIIPILERLDEVTQRQVDNDVKLEKTLDSLLKFLSGYGGDRQGGRGGGQPPEKNPLQNKNPSSLMNVFSWMGEKKDKAVEFIKKGFFKLFKTDYFGNLFKAINNLAKALTNSFMSWLKFFLMMAFIDPSGGFLRDIINLFTEIGMMLFKIIMPLIPVAVKMMFDTIVYVFKLVLRLMPEIISTIMQTFTQLGNTFPILKPIIFFINQFLSAIRSLFVILNDPKADKGKGFQNFLNKVFKILGSAVEKILDFIVEKAPIVFNFLLDFIQNTLIPALIKYVPKILDAFSEGIDALIKKYPNLKVWIQPIKDIFDMLSAYIGSFAKFNSGEFIQGLDTYKKKEEQLFKQRDYQNANEEKRMKMLSDMQYGFIVDNKAIVEKAQQDFNKMNEDKLNLAKTKWDDFLTHIMETIGKVYDSSPTMAKVGLWAYIGITVAGWLASIVLWFGKIGSAIKLFGLAWAKFSVMIGDMFAWISLYGELFLIKLGSFLTSFGGWLLRIGSMVWGGIVTAFEAVVGAFTSGAVLVGALIVGAIIGVMYYFKDELLEWASSTFGKDSYIYQIFDGLFAMIDYSVAWLRDKIPFLFGDISASDEPKPKPKPATTNASLDAYTFDEIAKQRHEAEKNYLKSNQFFMDKKKEEGLKLRAIDNSNLFGDYGKTFSEKLNKEVDKHPVTVKVNATAKSDVNVNIPPITPTIDMKPINNSVSDFQMKLTNIFTILGRYARKVFTVGGYLMPKLEESIDYDKYTSEQMFRSQKIHEALVGNKKLSELALSENTVSQNDIKSALDEKFKNNFDLIDALQNIFNERKKSNQDINTTIIQYVSKRVAGKPFVVGGGN